MDPYTQQSLSTDPTELLSDADFAAVSAAAAAAVAAGEVDVGESVGVGVGEGSEDVMHYAEHEGHEHEHEHAHLGVGEGGGDEHGHEHGHEHEHAMLHQHVQLDEHGNVVPHEDGTGQGVPGYQGAPGAPAQKRKRQKLVMACHFCRRRKLKCDGARPACDNCVKRQEECAWDDNVRRRGPGKRTKVARMSSAQEAYMAGYGDEAGMHEHDGEHHEGHGGEGEEYDAGEHARALQLQEGAEGVMGAEEGVVEVDAHGNPIEGVVELDENGNPVEMQHEHQLEHAEGELEHGHGHEQELEVAHEDAELGHGHGQVAGGEEGEVEVVEGDEHQVAADTNAALIAAVAAAAADTQHMDETYGADGGVGGGVGVGELELPDHLKFHIDPALVDVDVDGQFGDTSHVHGHGHGHGHGQASGQKGTGQPGEDSSAFVFDDGTEDDLGQYIGDGDTRQYL